MNRLALAAALGLTVVGCAHSEPSAQNLQSEEEKCALVHTLLQEPVPSQRLQEISEAASQEVSVPVVVFLRDPAEGLLERFFEGDGATCGDNHFHVVRQLGREGLVLYLQETVEGYAYDVRRAGPEQLSMGGEPQGVVRRNASGGWVAATD
jgi:hypothetical protein